MISDTTIVESVRPRVMEFDLGALTHNYRTLRAQIGPEPHIIPALKGNAYGHGVGPIARCLAEFDINSLSTGSLQNALAIREAGIDLPIVMFGGTLPEGMPAMSLHRCNNMRPKPAI